MEINYALDSSIWLEYYDGSDPSLKELVEKRNIATSVIALAEIADVFERKKKNVDAFIRFIRSRGLILPLTFRSAVAAAKIKNAMRTKHKKFGLADACHLAIARERNVKLVTTDSDFKDVDDVIFLSKKK